MGRHSQGTGMIAALKFIHIAGLTVWCAGLIALPVLLQGYGAPRHQPEFMRFRLLTHVGYAAVATPAAIVAVSAGTALIFAQQVYHPWLLAKLALVAGMVLVHAWLGHLIQMSGERRSPVRLHVPLLGLLLVVPLMAGVLWLVLAKPDLARIERLMPAILLQPQDRGL